MKKYYVYAAKLAGVYRYIGFGHGKRYEHVNSGTSHIRILNEIVLKHDKRFDIIFLETGLSKGEAQEREQHYIKEFGRLDLNEGLLWNRTNGGIGFNGGHTKISREKIGLASTKMWNSLSDHQRKQRLDPFIERTKETRFQPGHRTHNTKKYNIYDNGDLVFTGTWKECLKKFPDKEGSLLNLKNKPGFISRWGKCRGWHVLSC